ncbi:glycoside hydrolase family 57 protein [bacterium]
MLNEKGYLCLVLHAHLPFVRHPEYNDFLEEDWLYEAITETYIPLIQVFDGLIDHGIDFRITMSLTPTLCNMLSDELLCERYTRHLKKNIEFSEKELERTFYTPFYEAAKMYESKFKSCWHIFNDKYNGKLLNAFKKFQDFGKLEIITCGATHGFLPLMINENNVKAQIKVACEDYKVHFGREPKGIWLPECGYRIGYDKFLKDSDIKYFFTDTHGILYGSPRPRYGIYSPIYCESGVAVFGRDIESSQQVWSAETGYPGDYRYREFYRDAGYDLEYDYVKPYLHEDGVKRGIGIKYHKITGKVGMGQKQPYSPFSACEAAAEHAGNFLFNRQKQVEYLHDAMDRKPIIVAPYDAELFGHWWYEGPKFLNFLFRKLQHDQDTIRTITPSEYLNENQVLQVQQPTCSSWGNKGYNEFWLNGDNDWVYRHLHKIGDLMTELAQQNKDTYGLKKRALNQAGRELLLAQSSDWAFILSTGTMTEYALKRTKDHINRFLKLYDAIQSNQINETYLKEIESMDNIFQHIDYKSWGN